MGRERGGTRTSKVDRLASVRHTGRTQENLRETGGHGPLSEWQACDRKDMLLLP